MARHIAHRLMISLPVLLGVLLIGFLLLQVVPTDPASAGVWANYLSSWTFWNHVRTIGSLAAMAAFILSLRD